MVPGEPPGSGRPPVTGCPAHQLRGHLWPGSFTLVGLFQDLGPGCVWLREGWREKSPRTQARWSAVTHVAPPESTSTHVWALQAQCSRPDDCGRPQGDLCHRVGTRQRNAVGCREGRHADSLTQRQQRSWGAGGLPFWKEIQRALRRGSQLRGCWTGGSPGFSRHWGLGCQQRAHVCRRVRPCRVPARVPEGGA